MLEGGVGHPEGKECDAKGEHACTCTWMLNVICYTFEHARVRWII